MCRLPQGLQGLLSYIPLAYSKLILAPTGMSLSQFLEDSSFRSTVENADILLAPHDGRDLGISSEFANLFNPRLAFISDG